MDDFDDYSHSLSDEAEKAVDFVKFGVKSIFVSKNLENSDKIAYLNLMTLEEHAFCIRLTIKGYQVVGYEHDVNDEKDEFCAETIDALLNLISPLFVQKFSEKLTDKLRCLEYVDDLEETPIKLIL